MITIYDMGSYHVEAKSAEPPPVAEDIPDRQQYSATLQLICVEAHPYGCDQPATLPPWLASRYLDDIDS